MTLENHLRDVVVSHGGYSAEDDPATIILDANESPYDLPDDVKRDALDRLEDIPFNRYPDSSSRELRRRYADYAGVDPQWVVAGNGSDELITYLISAVVDPGDKVLVPTPTFSMYNLLARYLHADIIDAPLDDKWNLTDQIIRQSQRASLTFIGYPNNPTGNCFSKDRVCELIETTNGLVVLDEAYFEFTGGQTFVDRLDEDQPLVVLRTLSKGFAMAGLRTGFLLAPPAIVNGVNTVRLPYNLNRLSVATAEVALERKDEILKRNQTILEERDRIHEILDSEGFRPYPTDSNFILFHPDNPDTLHEHLLNNGIRVRSFSEPELENCLRLSVGTPNENDSLIKALKSFDPVG